MAIQNLSARDAVTASTYFAINVNGQDYRVSAPLLLEYLQESLGTPAYFKQSSVPAASGFSIQVNDDSENVWLIISPLGAYAAGTIVLPAVANCIDGQEIIVFCTQAVTTLTVSGNGAVDVLGEPTAFTANGYFRLRYEATAQIWYRVG